MVETRLVLRWVWKLGFRQIGVLDELDLGEKDSHDFDREKLRRR
jgi:hypothetical protein